MKTLTLDVQSARVHRDNWKRLTREEMILEFSKKVLPHSIANSILVLCGYSPVSNYMGLGKLWPTDNKFYQAVTSAPISFDFEHVFTETCSIFKSNGADTGGAKTGVFDKTFFENSYYHQRGDFIPGLADEFESWLISRYNDISFGSCFAAFCKEVLAANVLSSQASLDSWLAANLPSKFHVFKFAQKWAWTDDDMSKVVTRPVFVRDNGKTFVASNVGSVVLNGGPRDALHAKFKVKIELEDEMYYQIMNSRAGCCSFASICDGGVIRIEDANE